MRRMTATRAVAAAVVATSLALSGALLPSGAADAASAASSTVSVAMPGPGHSSSWSGSIANPGRDAAEAFLTVTEVGGSADAFGDLLTATVTLPSGRVLIPQTPVARMLGGAPIALGPIAAGSTVTIVGTVALAREAGDEFQGLSAAVVFQLTAVEKTQPHPPIAPPIALPDTGSTIAVTAIAVAAAAILGGAILLIVRRTKKRREEP